VDLSLFPIDTIKTRLQSEKGFLGAGGFRGLYKGIGSPAVGAMPGGEPPPLEPSPQLTSACPPAAIFFAVYDGMKQNLPLAGPALHITAASAGEVVSPLFPCPGAAARWLTPVERQRVSSACRRT
jgi:solute carrier family 25 S-adenosylmethionine transporter 26